MKQIPHVLLSTRVNHYVFLVVAFLLHSFSNANAQCTGYNVLETVVCSSIAGDVCDLNSEFIPGDAPLAMIRLDEVEGSHQVRMNWYNPYRLIVFLLGLSTDT
ncbi:MAG: hypothetical protein H6574_09060 [Lewinellaceae bacterium]|nr:hypothetical protein [Lewinellaceae bacterium]